MEQKDLLKALYMPPWMMAKEATLDDPAFMESLWATLNGLSPDTWMGKFDQWSGIDKIMQQVRGPVGPQLYEKPGIDKETATRAWEYEMDRVYGPDRPK